MTDGDHRGDEEAWRPPDASPVTPEPSEEPPPPPPPAAARRSGTPHRSPTAAPFGAADDGPEPADEEGGRRLRPKLVLAILGAVLVIAIPVGLAIAAAVSAPDAEESTAADTDADAGTDGDTAPEDSGNPDSDAADPPAEGEEDLAADLDLDALSGRDEAFARLLLQVDASEQAMIGFQGAFEELLSDPTAEDPQALIDQLRDAAEAGREELAEVRPDLAAEADDPDADEVRAVYLEHHDVWADYLGAIVENPAVVASEDGEQWSVAINASAEAFERTLRDNLDGLDDEVRDLGERILGRGFERGEIRPDA